jgi:serine beta-lactamase-like protein LACTB, mitochondrial
MGTGDSPRSPVTGPWWLVRRLRAAALGLGATTAVAWSSAAQAGDPIAGARAKVTAYVAAQHVPGASIAVGRAGEILWSEAFGFANLEHRVPASRETRFRVGSISKALTSVAVAKLWQEGRLDLDSAVQRYAPTFPTKPYPITTRKLAGHLSGLPHYSAADIVNAVHYESVTAALAKFQDRPLLFPPGERYSYSSFGWNLISVVVEGASGENFLEYMRRSVFAPFGMAATMADHYDQIIEHRTAFYQVRPDGRTLNGPAVDNSDVWAGGGFLSTAEDLVRFAHGVLRGGVLESRAVDLLFTPMKTTAGVATGYGLGWRIKDVAGRRSVGHGGSHVGATAELLVFPDDDFAVAILTNSNNRGLEALAREIASLLSPTR